MHKISIRSTLQSSAAALTLLGASVASAFDCPRDLSTPPAKPDVKVTDAGEADFPDAHIEYRSWGWVDGSSFMCNCVRNLHSRAVKIDWDGVELSGYPTLNDDLSSMESVQGLDYVEGRPTTITFGTRTRQIKAAFETEDIDTAEASTDGGKYSDSTHEGPATFSTGKISVPRLDLLESVAGDEEQVMAALSREPDRWLQKVVMTFTSQAVEVDGVVQVNYHCAYTVSGGDTASVAIRIAEPTVHEAVFNQPGPLLVNQQWQLGQEIPMDGSAAFKMSMSDLRVGSTTMQLVGPDNEVLGSMPIKYLTGA